MPSIRYPLFHWVATLVLGPGFWFAYEFINDPHPHAVPDWDLYGLALLFGGMFSLPIFLAYCVCYHRLRRSSASNLLLKALFDIGLIGCAGAMMAWMGGSLMPTLFWSYSAAIVVSSLPFRMER